MWCLPARHQFPGPQWWTGTYLIFKPREDVIPANGRRSKNIIKLKPCRSISGRRPAKTRRVWMPKLTPTLKGFRAWWKCIHWEQRSGGEPGGDVAGIKWFWLWLITSCFTCVLKWKCELLGRSLRFKILPTHLWRFGCMMEAMQHKFKPLRKDECVYFQSWIHSASWNTFPSSVTCSSFLPVKRQVFSCHCFSTLIFL